MVPDLDLQQFLSGLKPAQSEQTRAATTYASNSDGNQGRVPETPAALLNTENPLLYYEADDPT